MAKKDYYEILGVPKDAPLDAIKKAYRSLALKHHPDRVQESEKKQAEEKFKEISEAYGVVSDPAKRKTYDQFGHSGIDQNYTAEDIFRGGDFSGAGVDLGDILGRMFGGGFEEAFGGAFGNAGDILGYLSSRGLARRFGTQKQGSLAADYYKSAADNDNLDYAPPDEADNPFDPYGRTYGHE